MKNRPYKVIMSRGDDIQIDADEVKNVLKAISGGQPAVVRTGIFNPSFCVSVVKDKQRWVRFLEDIKYTDNKKELLITGVPQLKNMFEDTVLKLSVNN